MSAVTTPRSLTVGEIAQILDAEVLGSDSATIDDVEILERAQTRHLTYVGDLKGLPRLKHCRATVIIAPVNLRDELLRFQDRTFLLVPQPEVAFLSIALLLKPPRARSRIGISDGEDRREHKYPSAGRDRRGCGDRTQLRHSFGGSRR